MRISKFRVLNVRNLQETEIEPAGHINLLFGKNASGKTSLLEALFVLSRGKSFRTSQLRHLIQKGKENFTIFGRVTGENKGSLEMGVSYQNRRIKLQVQGRPIKKASKLASYLPMVVIHQESHRLLLEGPGQRRSFMDWALFHVEPSFHAVWRRYNRALKQRNISLQRHAPRRECELWNEELSVTARTIHGLRAAFLNELKPCFDQYKADLLPDMGEIQMSYRAGWPEGMDYAETLVEAYEGDRACTYTRHGPHRADIVLTQNGVLLKERVSRGQQKLLVCALYLAQSRYFTEKTGKPCVVLLDDLAAELDVWHRNQLLALISRLNVQVFMTATEPMEALSDELIQKRFHVEHGEVKQVL